jgi:nicotinamide mononucleotide (NMN) deamidase PncC
MARRGSSALALMASGGGGPTGAAEESPSGRMALAAGTSATLVSHGVR